VRTKLSALQADPQANFLKQSGRLPGYEIEHEKFMRENECESGLQTGPAVAGFTGPANRCGQELATAWMRRLVEVSDAGKAPVQFRARPGQPRPARGGAAGKHTQIVTGMVQEAALVSMRAIISNRYARVLRSTMFQA
jgi:hypothetical protein